MAYRSNPQFMPVNIGSGLSSPSPYTTQEGDLWVTDRSNAERLTMNVNGSWIDVGGRFPGVIVERTSNYSIASGADTFIPWSRSTFSRSANTGSSMWSSGSSVYIREEGMYYLSFNCRLTAGGNNGERYFAITVNGLNNRVAAANTDRNNAPDVALQCGVLRYCSNGDEVQALVYQNSGSTRSASIQFGGTSLCVMKTGE